MYLKNRKFNRLEIMNKRPQVEKNSEKNYEFFKRESKQLLDMTF